MFVDALLLNLLGLVVNLDDCDDGPVQICISADPAGGLLGQLLCALADTGLNLNLNQVLQVVDRVLNPRGNRPLVPPGRSR